MAGLARGDRNRLLGRFGRHFLVLDLLERVLDVAREHVESGPGLFASVR